MLSQHSINIKSTLYPHVRVEKVLRKCGHGTHGLFPSKIYGRQKYGQCVDVENVLRKCGHRSVDKMWALISSGILEENLLIF